MEPNQLFAHQRKQKQSSIDKHRLRLNSVLSHTSTTYSGIVTRNVCFSRRTQLLITPIYSITEAGQAKEQHAADRNQPQRHLQLSEYKFRYSRKLLVASLSTFWEFASAFVLDCGNSCDPFCLSELNKVSYEGRFA